MEPPHENIFPPEFCNEICTIQFFSLKRVTFQNGGQITHFYLASFRFWPKLEKKTTFCKEFFNEIWLKVGEHE